MEDVSTYREPLQYVITGKEILEGLNAQLTFKSSTVEIKNAIYSMQSLSIT